MVAIHQSNPQMTQYGKNRGFWLHVGVQQPSLSMDRHETFMAWAKKTGDHTGNWQPHREGVDALRAHRKSDYTIKWVVTLSTEVVMSSLATILFGRELISSLLIMAYSLYSDTDMF